jgi:molybdate transport system substrate-binding protein
VLAAQEVPAGRYALQFLDNAAAELGTDYRERVLQNVASYELNVRAVLTKVTLGEADAGIVYSSDISGLSSAEVGKLEIPEHLNVVAYYYVAPLNDAANSSLARAFVDYILSAPGQGILRRYGLIPVSDSAQE